MTHLPVTILYKVDSNGDLYSNSAETIKKNLWKKTLVPGQIVEITYQVYNPDHSYAQLSKLHPMIRELSIETGVIFEEMKTIIKKKTGLYASNGDFKSFGECNKDELSSAIQTCEELMNFIKPSIDEY